LARALARLCQCVIPAKAGIQGLSRDAANYSAASQPYHLKLFAKIKMDPSLRWDDDASDDDIGVEQRIRESWLPFSLREKVARSAG